MNTKEIVKEILAKWEFPIIAEIETAISLRYQLNYVSIGSFREEAKSLAVQVSGIFHADNETEYFNALKACNKIDLDLLQVKAYLDDDLDLVIANEFVYETAEGLEDLLEYALRSIIVGKLKFLSIYKELEDDDRLVKELMEEAEEETSDTDDDDDATIDDAWVE